MTVVPFKTPKQPTCLDDLPQPHYEDETHARQFEEEFHLQEIANGYNLCAEYDASRDIELPPRGKSIASLAVGIWSDPAPVIGLCFIYGRIAAATGVGLPRPLAALLMTHVTRGDLAAELTANWLATQGLIEEHEQPITKPSVVSGLSASGDGSDA